MAMYGNGARIILTGTNYIPKMEALFLSKALTGSFVAAVITTGLFTAPYPGVTKLPPSALTDVSDFV